MSDFVNDLPDVVAPAPRWRWLKWTKNVSKPVLSRYDPDETGPGDHYISHAASHLSEALYLHGASRCCVFPLSDGQLTLLALRDEGGVRKYTLLVRVKDVILSNARIIVQDGLYAGSVLRLDGTFSGVSAPERFFEDKNPDFSSTEIHLYYDLNGKTEVKPLSFKPYVAEDCRA